MNRLVSPLLIFSLLLVQSLPHSHAGSGVAQPDDHGSRPHIHLSLDSHSHGHSHDEHQDEAHCHQDSSDHSGELAQDGASDLYCVNGHDSDAVYLAGSTLSLHRLSANGFPSHFTSLHGDLPERFCIGRTSEGEAYAPPIRHRPLPIYLLVASLRL